MNAGWFPPPHAYIAVPVLKDLVFGFGTYCEYGLGTKYDNDWDLRFYTTETTIQQFTFNPNIAYKITDKWSVALGARMSYITFENYKTPWDEDNFLNPGLPGIPPAYPLGQQYIRTHLEGDDFNCGYELATQYKVTDDLKLGFVYRSRINHRIEGDFDLNSIPMNLSGDASAKLVLPASVTMGANYDFTERFRGGAALTWTEWSTINHIDFRIPIPRTQELNWHDAWRVGFGFEYDFTDAFCGRIGYTYDWDPSAEAHGTTMLPSGDRHIIGFGIGYKILEDLRIDLGYNFIMMESESRMVEGVKFQCDNSYTHIASASLTYSF
jgi:long-chain fatty acid transport protein